MLHISLAHLSHAMRFGLGALALSVSAAAQDDVSRRVLELEQRLAVVEGEGNASNGMVASYDDVTVTFQLFGDTGVTYSDPDPDGSGSTSFLFGNLDVFITAQVGDSFQFLSETVLSSAGDATFDEERLWGAWTFDDRLYAKLGLEHSPITLWSRRYHHGAWLEPTIARPLMASFEGSDDGFLPLHNQGLELGGSMSAGEGQVSYTLVLSNGRGMEPDDKQASFDSNDSKAILAALSWSPFPGGAQAGVAAQVDNIPGDPASASPALTDDIEEFVGTAFIEATLGNVELLAEVATMTNETTANGEDFDHFSGYVQLLAPLAENWTPYLRFDVKGMDEGDPYLMQGDRDLDQWRQTIGVRYDMASHAALKFEVGFGERDERDGAGAIDEENFVTVAFQLSVAI